MNESSLKLYRYDDAGRQWLAVTPCTPDSAAGRVFASTSTGAGGLYALLGASTKVYLPIIAGQAK